MKAPMKNKPAAGTRGFLLRIAAEPGYVFRVYDKHHNFVDYDILHYDMEVEILDRDATFYTDGNESWIDHSLETLGYKK